MGKVHCRGFTSLLVSVAFALGFAGPGFAQSLPTGGAVAAGAATIATPSGTSLVVTQTSRNAIINWGSFSVGRGNNVAFQNGSGATLNRVVGNVPSRLDGTITATGSLFLVNPAGVAIGTTGRIATGGSFLASTLDVPDADFMKGGDLTFKGASTASVVNYGEIGSLGGDVALIARKVENAGTITAPNGTAALAAGYEVLVRDGDLDGGKFVVKVGGADTAAKTSGKIRAAAVELRANGGNVYALAGNTDGIVAATGTATKGGRIFLTAGDAGSVAVSQKVVARSAPSGGKAKGGAIRVAAKTVSLAATLDARGDGDAGGSIVVSGETIALGAASRLDASGTIGGTVLVGGDFQGGSTATKYLTETVATAKTVDVASGATIAADGSAGAGGKVVVWSDAHTTFQGAITATGATVGGDAEVSGKAVLDYRGTADLRSPTGRFGTLLLDPYNLTISNASSSGMSGFNANADDSVLNVTALTSALATASVTVTTGSGGSQAGNITVSSAISWSATSTLTLLAAGNIAINAAISGQSGGLTLSSGASGTISASAAINVGTYIQTAGTFSQVAGTLPVFTAGDFRITGGTFVRATGGDGSSATPYVIADVYGLQGIGSAGMTNRSFALASDIDASGTTDWNSGAGFVPIGSNSSLFYGQLDGQGHVISGLAINRPSTDYVGLFSYIGVGAVIRDVGLVGGSVQGFWSVGALAGENDGTITQVYAIGAVGGTRYVGGLVGFNTGTVAQAHATGAVLASTRAGGLVGYNFGGTIRQAYATGAVTGVGSDKSRLGGLVGTNDGGTISDVYATGAVTGVNYIGGLVGRIVGGGSITRAYASGLVMGSTNVGGFAGLISDGTVTNSFWILETTGQSSGSGSGSVSAGGVTGLTTAQATNPFTYIDAGWNFTTVWGKSASGANSGYMMLRPLSSGLYDDYVSLAGNTTKIYGDANPSLSGIELSGVGTSNVTLAWAPNTNQTSGAGTYQYSTGTVIAVTDTPGRTAYVDYGVDALTIGQRAITVAANSQEMIYGNSLPGLTWTVTSGDLVNGDALLGALATAASSTANVGAYSINQGTLTASANYALTFVGAVVNVARRGITVAANNATMVVLSPLPTLTWRISTGSLVNGDALSGALATTATSSSRPGVYAILQGTLGAPANYTLTYVSGALTVTTTPVLQIALLAATPNRFVETSASNATVVFTTGSASPLAVTTDGTSEEADAGCTGGATSSAACAATPNPASRRISRFLTFSAVAPPTGNSAAGVATTLP